MWLRIIIVKIILWLLLWKFEYREEVNMEVVLWGRLVWFFCNVWLLLCFCFNERGFINVILRFLLDIMWRRIRL